MRFSSAVSSYRIPFKHNPWIIISLIFFFAVWADSLICTPDVNNWLLENVLTFGFLIFLAVTYRKYQYSDLSYVLMAIYLCLHVYGSKYTYADNTFGYWLQDTFDLARNHYDRIVHFSFGFLLAYPMRETFLRWLGYPKMVAWLLPIEITLSISGLYELIEWAVADIFFAEQGDAYLGTQGDIWDAQKDMFLATLGAALATLIVSSVKRILGIQGDEDRQ